MRKRRGGGPTYSAPAADTVGYRVSKKGSRKMLGGQTIRPISISRVVDPHTIHRADAFYMSDPQTIYIFFFYFVI